MMNKVKIATAPSWTIVRTLMDLLVIGSPRHDDDDGARHRIHTIRRVMMKMGTDYGDAGKMKNVSVVDLFNQ